MEASQLSNRESPQVILIERGESRERYKDSVGIQPTRDITEGDRDRRVKQKKDSIYGARQVLAAIYIPTISHV